jgi:hypothetical protein
MLMPQYQNLICAGNTESESDPKAHNEHESDSATVKNIGDKKADPPKGYRRSHFIHIQALSKRVPNGIYTAQYV